MSKFNPNLPHDKYCNTPPPGAPKNAVFLQNGFYYKANGEMLGKVPSEDVVIPIVDDEPKSVLNQPVSLAEEGLGLSLDDADTDLNGIHWTQLRKMMKDRGQPWTNRDDAIAYLAANPDEPEAAA